MPYLHPRRRDGIICLAFSTKERLLLDRGENSQSPRHRAEAMVGSRVLRDRRQSGGQNLGKLQLVGRLVLKPPKQINSADRGAGNSRKGLRQLRNSVLGFVVKPLTFHNEKPDTMVRRVVTMRRALFSRFSLRFLAAPTMRRGFEGAPLSFFRAEAAASNRIGAEG